MKNQYANLETSIDNKKFGEDSLRNQNNAAGLRSAGSIELLTRSRGKPNFHVSSTTWKTGFRNLLAEGMCLTGGALT